MESRGIGAVQVEEGERRGEEEVVDAVGRSGECGFGESLNES